uniref:BZIP domain-containing protein n=1 Tax=Pelusios castaneus TaxID=367368 RepID=A0A8C8RHN4_9SAUR
MAARGRGPGKMAALAPELLLLRDSGRFLADNLLSSEDWDAALYSCLDDGDEPAALFPCLEPDAMFEDDFDLGMDTGPPDLPWDQMPTSLFPDLQVKSEPVSPASSHSSDSSVLSMTSDSPGQAVSPDDMMGVKAEHPPTPPCMFGDVLAPPVSTMQITLLPAPETQAAPGKPVTPVKAESIVSRKPPIQPKPVVVATVPVQPAATHSPTILLQPVPGAQAQPLKPSGTAVPAPPVVISQSDLLHLPLSGLLKVQPLGKEGPPARPPPTAPKPEAKTIVPAPSQLGPCNPEIDVKVLKRQQRMIKNRESACQSRRKKKEYLQGLECRLREALADNERLRRENALLRRRLDCVLGEKRELKLGPGNRKIVCIMVVLLFIAFNFGPVSISEKKKKPVESAPAGQEPGAGQGRRHLLGLAEEPPREEQREEHTLANVGKSKFRNLTAAFSGMKDLVLRDLDKLFLASDCRQFNRTESLRLADELSGWVRRHQINRRKPPQSRKPRADQESAQRKAPSPSRLVSASLPERPERDSLSQLQVYQRPDRTEHDFMDAIDRREDTFYVVSFRRDHLLLPAISHNKTSRPKMSLVMPAMALNESLYNASRGYEVMMQIDCEVMDTRVIHIKSSTVPPSLRRHESPDNRTQAPPARGPLRAPRSLPSARRPRTFYLGDQGGG